MREVAAKTPGANGEPEKQALEAFNAKVAKYDAEKSEIKRKAELLEQDATRPAAADQRQPARQWMGLP